MFFLLHSWSTSFDTCMETRNCINRCIYSHVVNFATRVLWWQWPLQFLHHCMFIGRTGGLIVLQLYLSLYFTGAFSPYRQLLATISNSPQCRFEQVLWLCAGYSKGVVLALLFVARLSRVLSYQVCCTSLTHMYAVKNTGHHFPWWQLGSG